MQETKTKRLDRCFLTRSKIFDARKMITLRGHMKWLSNGVLNREREELNPDEILERSQDLRKIIPQPCIPLWDHFLNEDLTADQMEKTANLFKALSYDAPLRSFINGKLLELLHAHLPEDHLSEVVFQDIIQVAGTFNSLIGPFLTAFYCNGIIKQEAKDLIIHICQKVVEIAALKVNPAPAQPQEGSYNPPKYGRGYYFREDGLQVRNNRLHSIDKEGKKKQDMDDPAPTYRCQKWFIDVTHRGSRFLFLWFCPIHGHCWGFHIVEGSEGRKDASASLYTHLEVAPDELYMDFSCGTEEYCLNRESGYFQNTKFYHDEFHGVTHKCPEVYDAKGSSGKARINTSICEQFNSFAQSIKASSKNMSQVRFTFLVQYLIHNWNIRKMKAWEEKMKVVEAVMR